MIASRYRGSLAVWALLLAYASLYPFVPLRLPSMEEVGAFFVWPGYATGFDVALNILAYVPLGTLACLYFRQAEPGVKAILKAVGIGAALSFAMESSQLFVPYRVASSTTSPRTPAARSGARCSSPIRSIRSSRDRSASYASAP